MRASEVASCLFVLALGCGESSSTCLDGDGDGYGNGETCVGPDCNDAVAEIHPGAVDVPYDGFDQDCDGRDLWDADADGQTKEGAPYGAATDCDDTDPREYVGAAFNEPGLSEFCRRDFDGDGYSDTSVACRMIFNGEICGGRGGDCDDADAATFPGSNARDPTCGPDLDGDGYTGGGLDCDDQNVAIPVPEVFGNGIDDDCNLLSNDDPVFDWAVAIGGPGADYIHHLSPLVDGVVVCGDQGGMAVFGLGANAVTLPAEPGGFVADYDPDGELRWAKPWAPGAFATPLPDHSTIVRASLIAPIVVGAGEPNERMLTPSGTNDLLLARLARDGTLLWVKSAGGPNANCSSTAMAVLLDGSFLVAGDLYGTATFGTGEANETTLVGGDPVQARPFLARFLADGSLVWAQLAPFMGSTSAMAAKSDGTIVLLAYDPYASVVHEVIQVTFDAGGLEIDSHTLARTDGAVRGFAALAITELADGSMAISFGLSREVPEAEPEVVFQPGPTEVRMAGPQTFLARYTGGTLDWVRGFEGLTLVGIAPLAPETSIMALVHCDGFPCVDGTIEQPGRGVGMVELDASGVVSAFHWSRADVTVPLSSGGSFGRSASYFAGSFAGEAVLGTDGPGPETLSSVAGSGDAVLFRLEP